MIATLPPCINCSGNIHKKINAPFAALPYFGPCPADYRYKMPAVVTEAPHLFFSETKDTAPSGMLATTSSLLISLAFAAGLSSEAPAPVLHRDVTAYVTGYNTIPRQTDPTPCIAASGANICGRHDAVACPRSISLGTTVEIRNATYVCEDRLAKKYDTRFDISCDKDTACPYQQTGWVDIKVFDVDPPGPTVATAKASPPPSAATAPIRLAGNLRPRHEPAPVRAFAALHPQLAAAAARVFPKARPQLAVAVARSPALPRTRLASATRVTILRGRG